MTILKLRQGIMMPSCQYAMPFNNQRHEELPFPKPKINNKYTQTDARDPNTISQICPCREMQIVTPSV